MNRVQALFNYTKEDEFVFHMAALSNAVSYLRDVKTELLYQHVIKNTETVDFIVCVCETLNEKMKDLNDYLRSDAHTSAPQDK